MFVFRTGNLGTLRNLNYDINVKHSLSPIPTKASIVDLNWVMTFLQDISSRPHTTLKKTNSRNTVFIALRQLIAVSKDTTSTER